MLVALSVALTSALAQDSVRSIRYFEMEPTPYGEILVSKPVLEWKVWGEGIGIRSVEATVDDSEVDSGYSQDRTSVLASLNRPLSPGEHSVRFKVSFASGHKIEKSWEFRVAKGAISQFPLLLKNQTFLVKRVNEIRKHHSLPPVTLNESLNAAAQAHVDYMVTNGTSGHKEEVRGNGFTGKTPGDRARAFGYYERNGEAVAVSSDGFDESLQDLFVAPYHRVMFLQPGNPDFGAGNREDATCIKFGGKHEDAIVVSPANSATDVQREWDGIETPDPMAGHAAQGPYGFPIVMAVFGKYAEKFSVSSAFLKDEKGKPVEVRVLHPGNDSHSKNCVIVVPLKPLKTKSTYSVEVNFSSIGQLRKQAWKFTTS